MAKRAVAAKRSKAAGAKDTDALDQAGPESTQATLAGLVAANLALRLGSSLLRRTVSQRLGEDQLRAKAPSSTFKGKGIVHSLVGKALVGVAARSVPGAIVVGGGLLAKTLYDRRRKRGHAQADPAGPDSGSTG